MDGTSGYVYVMINSSLTGIVKIGKTQNSPEERAKELSSATGVPAPFFVAYSAYFADCSAAEIFVHRLLGNNRLANNREFFRVSVQLAIAAVREAEGTLGTISPDAARPERMGDTTTDNSNMWDGFSQRPQEVQDTLLKELKKLLQSMTAKQQAKAFEGAPGVVILEFLPSLEWDVQVVVYKYFLPVADRQYAIGGLKEQAKVKLGLEPKKKLSKFSFLS
jgi:hypothetical protein